MTQQRHGLEVYEPYEYEGDNPLWLSAVGVIKGPTGSPCFLLDVNHPFEYQGKQVNQLLLNCRYQEDGIERPVSGGCTVNIAIVHSDTTLTLETAITFEHFTHWGVGKITPYHE